MFCFLFLCLVAAGHYEADQRTWRAQDSNDYDLGVCYYPEQWGLEILDEDAKGMAELGIKYVRIGEFMWSHIQPSEEEYHWETLDKTLATLQKHNLSGILGTPTATPPKWLIDKAINLTKDFRPYNDQGQVRHFGSRRHYSFSSPWYSNATKIIVTQLAKRYGNHPALAGWQLDNEYGCHDTVRTYDPDAAKAFQTWLAKKYNDITKLNEAWGNVFWSMEYQDFMAVGMPFLTVTEANPAARMDFFRFSSDQVVRYNQLQAGIIRSNSPHRFVTTNFMGWFFHFDAFKLAKDLDFATWDSYPLGFTDTTLGVGEIFTDQEKVQFARTGHPDLASMHHDLYRAVGRGKFGVMEQQPGPVNWASHNPSPADGMVRLWSWETFAHKGSLSSYFRWREVPFAQEQMHSGLNRRDFTPDQGYQEVEQFYQELQQLPSSPAAASTAATGTRWPSANSTLAHVAVLFDYEAVWAYEIQPQNSDWTYAKLLFSFYSAVRALGLDVDFIDAQSVVSEQQLTPYSMVVVPSLPFLSLSVVHALTLYNGTVVLGPRSGSKTDSFQIPFSLPPAVADPVPAPTRQTGQTGQTGQTAGSGAGGWLDPLQRILPIKVTRVESLRTDSVEAVSFRGSNYTTAVWKEWIESHPAATASSPPHSSSSSSVGRCDGVCDFETEEVRVSIPGRFLIDNKAAVVVAAAKDSARTLHYLAFWPSARFLNEYLGTVVCDTVRESPLPALQPSLPSTLRISQRGNLEFAFNYNSEPVQVPAYAASQAFVIGGPTVPAHGVSVWRCSCEQDPIFCCRPAACIVPESPVKSVDTTMIALVSSFLAIVFIGLVTVVFKFCKKRREPQPNISSTTPQIGHHTPKSSRADPQNATTTRRAKTTDDLTQRLL